MASCDDRPVSTRSPDGAQAKSGTAVPHRYAAPHSAALHAGYTFEGSFGFLTDQVKGVHKDLLAFQARTEQQFDQIDGRFGQVDGRLVRIEGRLDRVEKSVKDLRQDMPGIVSDAMREVLREREKKSRT